MEEGAEKFLEDFPSCLFYSPGYRALDVKTFQSRSPQQRALRAHGCVLAAHRHGGPGPETLTPSALADPGPGPACDSRGPLPAPFTPSRLYAGRAAGPSARARGDVCVGSPHSPHTRPAPAENVLQI